MAHFFISYSHLDATYVRRLAQALEEEGYSPWVDDRIDYGSTWDEEVERRLDGCAAFILVMSPNSSTSRWVKNELNRAMRKNKPIFPLLLEGDEPWLAVESIQFLDVRGGRLPDERFYQHLSKYAAREKPVRGDKPGVKKETTEDAIHPVETVEKVIVEEFHPSRPEETNTREISPAEISTRETPVAEMIPVDQDVEQELPGQPIKDDQGIEKTPPLVKKSRQQKQPDWVPEKLGQETKLPPPRLKKEKQIEPKPARMPKARQRGAEWRKEVPRAVIAGAIMVVAVGVGGTLWAFRGSLGFPPAPEETPALTQAVAGTPTQTATVSLPTQTAMLLPAIRITIDNAGQVTELMHWGDEGVINQLVINSTGTTLAVGTSQGVYLLDPVTLEQLDFLAYESDVTALAFTKEGNTLAIGLADGAIEVKDVDNLDGDAIYSLQLTSSVHSLAFNPYGTYLVAGSDDQTIPVWSMEDGALIMILTGHQYEVSVVVFLDDTMLASASGNGTIRLWQIPEGNEIAALPGQAAGVLSLAVSPDGSTFALGRADGVIQIWSIPERRTIYQLEGHAYGVTRLAFNPTGDILASAGEDPVDGVHLWVIEESDGRLITTLEGNDAVFTPDEGSLITYDNRSGEVKSWETAAWSEKDRSDQFATHVLWTALSLDGKLLAERMGGNVQLRNIADGTLSRVLENDGGIDIMGFSQDGEYLATVRSTGIGRWSVPTGNWFDNAWETSEQFYAIAYNPVFDKVAVGFTDGVIRIFDFQSNLLESWGTAQSGKAVRRLEYCPTASYLAASYEDGSLVIWKETGGEPRVDFSYAYVGAINIMSYSPSCDTLLLVGEDGKVRYFPDESGDISDLALPEEVSSVSMLEFSPDGTILAIATDNFEITLLDFETMELLNTLKGHTKDITSLAFVPDASRMLIFRGTSLLISTSMDGATRLWGVGE